MPYSFQNRLARNSVRMKAINTEVVSYSGLRSGITVVVVISASPILGEAEEIDPGISILRIEIQDWGVDITDLGTVIGLPQIGDEIIRASGDRFGVCSLMGDEPPFKFVMSTRTRLLIHTKRTKRTSP